MEGNEDEPGIQDIDFWPSQGTYDAPEFATLPVYGGGVGPGPYEVFQSSLSIGKAGEYARLYLVVTLDTNARKIVVEQTALVVSDSRDKDDRSQRTVARDIGVFLEQLDCAFGGSAALTRRGTQGDSVHGLLDAVLFADVSNDQMGGMTRWTNLLYSPNDHCLIPYFKRQAGPSEGNTASKPLTVIYCPDLELYLKGRRLRDGPTMTTNSCTIQLSSKDMFQLIIDKDERSRFVCQFAYAVANDDLTGCNLLHHFNDDGDDDDENDFGSQNTALDPKNWSADDFFGENNVCLNGDEDKAFFAPRLFIMASSLPFPTLLVHRAATSQLFSLQLCLDCQHAYPRSIDILNLLPGLSATTLGVLYLNWGHIRPEYGLADRVISKILHNCLAKDRDLVIRLESMDSARPLDGPGAAIYAPAALTCVSACLLERQQQFIKISADFIPVRRLQFGSLDSGILDLRTQFLGWLATTWPQLFPGIINEAVAPAEFPVSNEDWNTFVAQLLHVLNDRTFRSNELSSASLFGYLLDSFRQRVPFVPNQNLPGLPPPPPPNPRLIRFCFRVTGDGMHQEWANGRDLKLSPQESTTSPRTMGARVKSLISSNDSDTLEAVMLSTSDAKQDDGTPNPPDDPPTPYVHNLSVPTEEPLALAPIDETAKPRKPKDPDSAEDIPALKPKPPNLTSSKLSVNGLYVFSRRLERPVILPPKEQPPLLADSTKEWYRVTSNNSTNPFISYLLSLYGKDTTARTFVQIDTAPSKPRWERLCVAFSIGRSLQVFVNSTEASSIQIGQDKDKKNILPEPCYYPKEGLLILSRDGLPGKNKPASSSSSAFSWTQLLAFLEFKPPSWLGAFINDDTMLVVDDGTAKEPGRNLVWLWPAEDKRVEHRLSLKLDSKDKTKAPEQEAGAVGQLLNVINSISGSDNDKLAPNPSGSNFRVVAKKTVRAASNSSEPQTQSSVDLCCQVKLPRLSQPFDLILSLSSDATTIRIRTEPSERSGSLAKILDWLITLVDDASSVFSEDVLKDQSKIFFKDGADENPRFSLEFVQLALTLKSTAAAQGTGDSQVAIKGVASKTPSTSLGMFELDLEAKGRIGEDDTAEEFISALLTFRWEDGRSSFTGTMWNKLDAKRNTVVPINLEIAYEPFLEVKPSQDTAQTYDIAKFLPNDTDLPDFLPTQLTGFFLEIASDGITFMASLGRQNNKRSDDVPMFQFSLLRLQSSIKLNKENKGREIAFIFTGEAVLQTRDWVAYPPATLSAKISYKTSSSGDDPSNTKSNTALELSGTAKALRMAHVFSLLNAEDAAAVMDFMEAIEIRDLTITYTFTNKTANSKVQKASAFSVTGSIVIGKVVLGLTLKVSASSFELGATLQPDVKQVAATTTVGALLADIDQEASERLPQFIARMEMDISTIGMRLDVFKPPPDDPVKDPSAPPTLAFALTLVLPKLVITVLQHQVAKQGTKAAVTTRLMRVILNGFPTAVDVPLIGELTPSFDQVHFMWISNPISSVLLGKLNDVLKPKESSKPILTSGDLLIKEVPEKDGTTTPLAQAEKIVLKKGFHLMVVASGTGNAGVILDYAFGGDQQSPTSTPPVEKEDQKDETPTGAESDVKPPMPENVVQPAKANGEMVTAPVQQNKGPLSIKNISFGLSTSEGSSITVKLDATFQFGPVSFTLLGLSVKISNLQNWDIDHLENLSIEPGLEGMVASYIQAPIVLAGIFRAVGGKYSGGLVLTFPPYSLLAMGEYRKSNDVMPESMYVLAILQGPLAQFEVAEISGVQAGFGYNSALTIPTATQVNDHPFLAEIKDTSLDKLKDTMTKGGEWFPPEDGTYWLAAGMRIKAMQTLDVKAILAVQFGSSLQISVFAQAGAEQPASLGEGKGPKPFIRVRLGMVGTLNVEKGIFKVEGQLAPTSYILHESCKLVGGFAVAFWFKGSEYAGDWVFTVGGYHPAYVKPAHYPIVNSQLGISWQYNSEIKIEGGAYLAVTPKCLMGGGRLLATLKKNNVAGGLADVDASFKAWADFLINYHPFHYVGEIGASIYARIKVDMLLATKTFKLDLSGVLQVAGPDFAGTLIIKGIPVIKTITVDFGKKSKAPDPLDWSQFCKVVKQSGNQKGPTDETTGAHSITLAEGGMGPSTEPGEDLNVAGPETPIFVRVGAFKLNVQSKFPIRDYTMHIGTEEVATEHFGHAINFKPMQKQSTSWLDVTFGGMTKAKFAKIEPIEAKIPAGLWDAYNKYTDPSNGTQAARALLGTGTDSLLDRVMGLTITSPAPDCGDTTSDPWTAFRARTDVYTDVFGNVEDTSGESKEKKKPRLPAHVLSNEICSPASLQSIDEKLPNLQHVWSRKAPLVDSVAVVDAWTTLFHPSDIKAPTLDLVPVPDDTEIPPSTGKTIIKAATLKPSQPMTSTVVQSSGSLSGKLPQSVISHPEKYYLDLPRVSGSIMANWTILASVSWTDNDQMKQARMYLHTGDGTLREAVMDQEGDFSLSSTFDPVEQMWGCCSAIFVPSFAWKGKILVFWEKDGQLYGRETDRNLKTWSDVDFPDAAKSIVEYGSIAAVTIPSPTETTGKIPEGRIYVMKAKPEPDDNTAAGILEICVEISSSVERSRTSQGATCDWPVLSTGPLSALVTTKTETGWLADISIFCLVVSGDTWEGRVWRYAWEAGWQSDWQLPGTSSSWCEIITRSAPGSDEVNSVSLIPIPVPDQGSSEQELSVGGSQAMLFTFQGGDLATDSDGTLIVWRYTFERRGWSRVLSIPRTSLEDGTWDDSNGGDVWKLVTGLSWSAKAATDSSGTTSNSGTSYAEASVWLYFRSIANRISRMEWSVGMNGDTRWKVDQL